MERRDVGEATGQRSRPEHRRRRAGAARAGDSLTLGRVTAVASEILAGQWWEREQHALASRPEATEAELLRAA